LRQVALVENTWFFFAIRDMEKGALSGKFSWTFNVPMQNRQRLLIPPYGGSNPPAPAKQLGLRSLISW
jgi:hypothetical protein